MTTGLTLKARLALLLCVLLGLMAMSASIALYRIRSVASSIDTVYRDRFVPVQQLRTVSDGYLIDIARNVWKAGEGHISSAQALREIDDAHKRIHSHWQAYLQTYLIESELRLIAVAQPLLHEADAAVARAQAALAANDIPAVRALSSEDMMPVAERVAQLITQLVDVQYETARRENAASQEAYNASIWTSAVLTLLAVAAGGGLAWMVFARYYSESKGAEQRTQRLHLFFRALAETNQLIVREHDTAQLFEKVCKICVDTGHALLAAIVIVEDGVAKRTVTAGGEQEIWDAFPLSWELASPQGQHLLSTQAILAGTHVICQNFQRDPRRAGLGQDSQRIGSLAAFPFRMDGKVSGTLVLCSSQVGYFDEHMVELLDEMAEDLSFALDNIGREHARLAAVQAVQEREQQLTGIVESTMEAIITIDERHRIIVFNVAAAAMFGVPAEQAIGQTLDRFIPMSARESHRKHVEGFSRTGLSSRMMGERRRLTGLRADGSEFPIEVSISRTGASPHPLMTAVIRDMTQSLEAERARRAQADAEAASKAKTEFLSCMSHELRTPLNAVLGFSELIRTTASDRLTSQELTQLEHVRKAGWHLLTLINDVLDVSSIESGRVQLNSRCLAVQPVLDEALRMIEPLARDSAVRVEAPHDVAKGIGVMADPLRLRQVLINLLSNAIKYNPRSGLVRVRLESDGHEVRIDVIDTGLGMSREQLAHLFEPFNRLGRERGRIEGTGIGLTLTRELVRLMHGHMEVESELGSGTRVRLSLPACLLTTQQEAGRQPTTASKPELPQPSGVVLYVEDNPVNLLLVEHMLAQWTGVRVVKAEDGASGIELARRELPDLVLLDMQLPDMHGIEVLQTLQADELTRRLRVIALSASAMPQEVERALRCGAADYWTKPLDFNGFLKDMRRVLPSEAVSSSA